jgi:hypothetical protein
VPTTKTITGMTTARATFTAVGSPPEPGGEVSPGLVPGLSDPLRRGSSDETQEVLAPLMLNRRLKLGSWSSRSMTQRELFSTGTFSFGFQLNQLPFMSSEYFCQYTNHIIGSVNLLAITSTKSILPGCPCLSSRLTSFLLPVH